MIMKYPYTDYNEYNLDWCITRIRDLTDEWAATHQEWLDTKHSWEEIQTEWGNYKNYIDTYFENLDLSQEVSDKIDQMAADGYFSNLFVTLFRSDILSTAADAAGTYTAEWIADNLLQETGYVLDSSLAVQNAAADAAAVGDALDEKADLVKKWSNNLWNGIYAGGFVNQTTGAWAPQAGDTPTYCGTEEYVEIKVPCVMVLHNSAGTGIAFRYALYDENKDYISGELNPTFTFVSTQHPFSYLVITNPSAKYIRFSATRATFTSGQIHIEVQRGTYPNYYTPYETGKELTASQIHDMVTDCLIGRSPMIQSRPTLNNMGQRLELGVNITVKNKKVYHFYAEINNSFTSMLCGHGKDDYSMYFEINTTSIVFMSDGVAGTTLTHGLTLDTFIDFMLIIGPENQGTVILNTLGGTYSHDVLISLGYLGDVFIENTGSNMSNANLSFVADGFKAPVWLFGDSYFTHTSVKRWPYWVINWGFDNFLLCGFPGADSSEMFQPFVDYVNLYGTPKYAVWCLGMNDPDTGGVVNPTWVTYAQMFIDICEAKQITPVFATIPNTPTITNYYKNEWIKSSGYRYIDFAKAVDAESIGATWYADTREDNTHPNENGAKLLALAALRDMPELMYK